MIKKKDLEKTEILLVVQPVTMKDKVGVVEQ